jgi:antitoxin (DNA-binding transcriptional repressor) of toxin-antitoxin stability system
MSDEGFMDYLQFTEFRNKSKEYFDKVEHGNSFVIIRKGKPIATLKPFKSEIAEGWKREIKKVKLKKCKDSTEYIISERNEK